MAWVTLRKAEKLGRETEQYEQLNAVYNLQIQHAESPHAAPLDEILPRYRANKKAADEEERANIADSLLRQRLRESRVRGRAVVAVAVSTSAYQERDAAGVVMAEAAAPPELRLRLVLASVGGRWRIEDVLSAETCPPETGAPNAGG